MSLEIETNLFAIYGFTLRRCSKNKPITKELYSEHLLKISCHGVLAEVTDVVFEEAGGLHCHGIIRVYRSTSLNRFRVRGWKLHLVEIYDLQMWQQYLNKEQVDLMPDMVDPPDDDFVWPTKRLF